MEWCDTPPRNSATQGIIQGRSVGKKRRGQGQGERDPSPAQRETTSSSLSAPVHVRYVPEVPSERIRCSPK